MDYFPYNSINLAIACKSSYPVISLSFQIRIVLANSAASESFFIFILFLIKIGEVYIIINTLHIKDNYNKRGVVPSESYMD